jgi:uncharacterized protein YecE (DUF72 family)
MDNLKCYIGCKGWKNQTWGREFYPPTLERRDYLVYYSKVFDFVEVDFNRRPSAHTNDFNKLPNKLHFKKWFENTSDNFRFSIKFPNISSKIPTKSVIF